MHNYFSETFLLKSEKLTLPFQFSKNVSIGQSYIFLRQAQVVVNMDNNYLLSFYLEAIPKNRFIQAQLSNRMTIRTMDQLLQAIKFIYLPQSPDAIAHRQSPSFSNFS